MEKVEQFAILLILYLVFLFYFLLYGKNCAPSVAIAISKLAILAISIPKKAKNPPKMNPKMTKIPAKICPRFVNLICSCIVSLATCLSCFSCSKSSFSM